MLVNLYKLALLATSLLPIASTLPSPSAPVPNGDPDRIPGKYIVTLRKGLDAPAVKQHMSFVQGVHARSNSGHSGVGRQWSLDLWNGYAGYFDEHTAEQIRKHENVQSVEPDRARHLYGALQVQGQAEWGLTALSHKSLNASATEYVYDNRAGEGGYAYIIDTGILDTHVEFEGGRAVKGYNAVDDVAFEDRQGHGTHVAGTICGKTYGVAKRATCVSVKVFDEGGSDSETVLEGLHWAVHNITSEGRAASSVINMSIGGAASAAENRAVEAAAAAGVTIVAAAGNDADDASNSSPASSPSAITVGAVGGDGGRAPFSNYGADVDVWAPGVGIRSAYIGGSGDSSNDATQVLDGTSMAAPHVSGLVLYLRSLQAAATGEGGQGTLDTPDAIAGRIKDLAATGVRDARGPGGRAYNGSGR